MKVCIAEKPSVARDIAQILGATTRRDGYFEGSGWCVTWVFGHLCELKEPHDYTPMWRAWSLSRLPMVPPYFDIKLKDDTGVKRQFNTIKTLTDQAEEVVNCGDAGQEGELIQRWVYHLAKVKCPIKRLWISSLTDDAIREGFRQLRPQSDFDSLYRAGMSRAVGDWLLGMNATRLYTLKYGSGMRGDILSIGRVQTPTLALIVSRQNEIDNFKPEPYWELKTVYRDATFVAAEGRFTKIEDAKKALEDVTGKPFTINSVNEKEGREAPPRLFDLTSLQVETNKKWGWSADETLRLIQALYEKKVTTYPRVDTTYLTDDIYPKVPEIMRGMKPYTALTARFADKRLPKSKKVFNNAKVTDHHAIIPTGIDPTGVLTDTREKQLYHLIALRFISVFYPDCIFKQTQVEGESGGIKFKATGKVIVAPGWKTVYGTDTDVKDTERGEDGLLPEFAVGESGPHAPTLQEKQTQPPKPYTEGTLLRAMETAGKTVDDEELRDALKENGIGRPSTRAGIIETLFKRGYIVKERKALRPTEAGKALVQTIHEELLKSARLTGLWENKLRRIEHGDYDAHRFVDELKVMIAEIVQTVLADNTNRKIATNSIASPAAKPKTAKSPRKSRVTKLEHITCPKCGKGHLIKGNTAYGCSEWKEGCSLRLSFDNYPHDLTPGQLNRLLKKFKP